LGPQDYACFTPLIDVCDGIADPRIFSIVIADCCREIISPTTFEFSVTPQANQSIVFTTIHGNLAFNHPVRGGAFTQRYGITCSE
jgi:hypothetical protein